MLNSRSAHQLNITLKAALRSLDEAQKCALLCFEEILERKLYRQLGYSTINQYAKIELGFSPGRIGDFLTLCRRLKKLPEVKAQIATGKLGYTKARTMLPVVDPTNERQWVNKALSCSRRELEMEVKRAKREAEDTKSKQPQLIPATKPALPAVLPVRINLEMSPTQFSKYEALWEKIRKQGNAPADQVEALLDIMTTFASQTYSREYVSSPIQVHIHQCPDCEKATVATGKGELTISAAEKERIQCDCQISTPSNPNKPGAPNKSAIRPTLRREVLAQARHKCQGAHCQHTRYLEIHHKIPRAKGGTNERENLICLCSACHSLAHAGTAREPAPSYDWGRISPSQWH